MSTTTISPDELRNMQGILDDDESADAIAVQEENDVAAESIDYTKLRQFIEAIGPDVMGSRLDWSVALGVSSSRLMIAEQQKEISMTTRRDSADGRSYGNTITGFTAANVLAWVEKSNVDYELADVARAMVNTMPAEAINADLLYTCESVTRQFGIPFTRIQDAVLGGEIRTAANPDIWASTSRIEGGPLAEWVTEKNIPIRVSIEVARLIVLRRRQVQPQVEAPIDPPSVITEAANILERERETERAVERENTNSIRKAYREILTRPQEHDAVRLAEICDELGLTPEDVHRDASLLERAADLAENAAGVDAAATELASAVDGLRDIKRRHETELKAAQSRLSVARERHRHATSAGPELQSLRERRPELFG